MYFLLRKRCFRPADTGDEDRQLFLNQALAVHERKTFGGMQQVNEPVYGRPERLCGLIRTTQAGSKQAGLNALLAYRPELLVASGSLSFEHA